MNDMKPIIAITSDYTYEQQKYTLFQYYVEAIKKAGGYPIMLFDDIDFPNCIDGILLTGGGDVNPLLFGEEPIVENGEICPLRDDFEYKLCQYAFRNKIPMLGICRGMQIIALCSGGSIYQDIYKQTNTNIKHIQKAPRFQPTHTIEIENSILYEIVNEKSCMVNSFHHQSVKEVGPNFIVSARSKDGMIEAIEQKSNHFVVGVQWHPETMTKDNIQQKLFELFVQKCKKEV